MYVQCMYLDTLFGKTFWWKFEAHVDVWWQLVSSEQLSQVDKKTKMLTLMILDLFHLQSLNYVMLVLEIQTENSIVSLYICESNLIRDW